MDADARRERLTRKLLKAEASDDASRAARLRAKLEALAPEAEAEAEAKPEAEPEAEPKAEPEAVPPLPPSAAVEKARRRLARAQQADSGADAALVARLQAKLARREAAAAADDAADDGAEASLREEHTASASASASSSSSSSFSSSPSSSSSSSSASSSSSSSSSAAAPSSGAEPDRSNMVLARNGVWYERKAPPPSNTTLLLFYAYVQPPWSPRERAQAVAFTQEALASRGCSGRLRVALEGFNGTLTGPAAGVRGFCDALRAYDARHFGSVDFKLVDGLADNKAFRSLKVWPVDELVTYGLRGAAEAEAPLSRGGTHLSPQAFEDMARSVPGAVIIDVRNANETAIGAFAPPAGGATVLDPRMRRSTEFPAWVEAHAAELRERPAVLMCE
jgi:hypothetical protein